MQGVRALVICGLLLWPVGAAPAATSLAIFNLEQQARQHCPDDVVVWLNPETQHYHFKGQRYYANTRQGAFACMLEANKAGYRATRVGP